MELVRRFRTLCDILCNLWMASDSVDQFLQLWQLLERIGQPSLRLKTTEKDIEIQVRQRQLTKKYTQS